MINLSKLQQHLNNTLRRYLNKDRIGCIRYSVTWRCNARCKSCSIWRKTTGENDLSVEEVDKFCKSSLLKNVGRIVLSGGEPTLRKDLPDLVFVLHKNFPKAKISMTINGLLADRSYKMIKEIVKRNPKLEIENIGISLNGPKEIHDRTRGIIGSFDNAVKTYKLVKDLVPTRFSFTYLEDNLNYFEWVQNYAKELGTEAYLCWTVMNDRFDTQNEAWEFLQKDLKNHLRDYLKDKKFFTRITLSYLYDNFLKKKFMQCYAARQFFHLDPEGNIYPCNFELSKDRILGNIRKTSFEEIWNDPKRQKILNEIDCGKCIYQNGPCGDSDLNYSNQNNLWALFKWYIKKKISFKDLIE